VFSGDEEHAALITMVAAALASVVMHGCGAPAAAHAVVRSEANRLHP
jgi:hypothetical protein